jgi:hypothetical protein
MNSGGQPTSQLPKPAIATRELTQIVILAALGTGRPLPPAGAPKVARRVRRIPYWKNVTKLA